MNADALVDLAARLAAQAPPESPESDFARAVERWSLGAVDTLDEALGLVGAPGRERAATRWRRAQRDRHLRRALALVEGDSPWRRCLALEREIERFESVIWPRWRDRTAPPPEASRLRAELFQARRLDALPTTARQLSNIARSESDGAY